MSRAILFAVAALSLWPTVAGAVDATNFALKTTENRYLVCSAAANDPLRPEAINFCEDFLLGVVTYHDAISDRQHLKRFICYPPSATRDQGIAKLSFLAKSTTPSVQLPSVPQGYPDTSRTTTYLVSARPNPNWGAASAALAVSFSRQSGRIALRSSQDSRILST